MLVRSCIAFDFGVWDPYHEDPITGEWPEYPGDGVCTPNVHTFIKECIEALPNDATAEGHTKRDILDWWNSALTDQWEEPFEVILVKSH